MNFYGRKQELAALDQCLASPRAEMVAVYGRRQIGKTALLSHWLAQQENIQPLTWFIEMGESSDQLRQFSQTLFKAVHGKEPDSLEYRCKSWEDAFLILAGFVKSQENGNRIIVILDEFTTLVDSDPAISTILRDAWNKHFKDSNVLLILNGSLQGLMNAHVLNEDAPLHDVVCQTISLEPFSFGQTADFFPHWGLEERIKLYTIWGGIPGYWDQLEPDKSLEDNLRRTLLTPNSSMHAEPRLLLYDHITEPARYISILRAISMGFRTPSGIGRITGITYTSLPPYLQKLEEIGVVGHNKSLSASPNSRSGRYSICDPYLWFYYRFLEPYTPEIRLGKIAETAAQINDQLETLMGTHTWSTLCREWTIRAARKGELAVCPEKVGSAWSKLGRINVYGLNEKEKTLVLGNCYWGKRPESLPALEALIADAEKIIPDPQGAKWQVLFIGFSRMGWTSTAKEYAEKNTPHNSIGGDTWECIGFRLLSLEELDHDLKAWA